MSNGANVTFANNTTVINDKAFGMDMVVDAGSTVTISDSEIMDLDTVRNTGSIVLTGDATLKAADLLSGSGEDHCASSRQYLLRIRLAF